MAILLVLAMARGGTSFELTATLPDLNTVEQVKKARQIVAGRIDAIEQHEDASVEETPQDVRELWRRVDAVYVQLISRGEERQKLEKEVADFKRQEESLEKVGPEEAKPYSFLVLEHLKDQIAIEKEQQETFAADLKSAEKLRQASRGELDEESAASKRSAKDSDDEHEPLTESATSAASAELAHAKAVLRAVTVAAQSLRRDVSTARLSFLEKKAALIEKDVAFTTDDRDRQLGVWSAASARLKRERHQTETALQEAEASQRANELDLTESHAPAATLEAAKNAWRSVADAYQNEIVLIDERLDNLANLRRFWKRRFELKTSPPDNEKLTAWLKEVDEYLEEFSDEIHALESRRDTAREEQTLITREPATEDAQVRAWNELRQARWQELRDMSATHLADDRAAQRMLTRFRDELKARIGDKTPGWSSPGEVLLSFWNMQIAGEDDAVVTLGTLLVLLIYIVAGIMAAYLLSRVVFRQLLPRLGMHPGTATALKSILFYGLCAIFGTLAFRMMHIPLAAFAFLGGAAAIAVGFGSQDIMNNFMSGVILLAEQPIRVGDFIQLSGSRGVVLHIGLRSTRIQTESNYELIVPNKSLIDEEVTNLTLSDNLVKLSVAVTLDRDTNIQEAKWEMQRIAFLHPLIIKSPRPVAVLTEVDNYWLVFEVHFWMQYSSFIRSATVQSDLLEQIGHRFRPQDEEPVKSADKPDADASEEEEPPVASDVEFNPVSMQKMGMAVAAKAMKRAGASLRIR